MDKHLDWDELLPFTMMTYRSSVHASTEESPNMVMLGRQAPRPIDVMTKDSLTRVKSTKYVKVLEDTIQNCHRRVRERISRAAVRQKKHYD